MLLQLHKLHKSGDWLEKLRSWSNLILVRIGPL